MPFLRLVGLLPQYMQCPLVNSSGNVPKFNINCTLSCSVLILYRADLPPSLTLLDIDTLNEETKLQLIHFLITNLIFLA